MKKIIFLLLLVCALPTIAQNNKHTITVIGETEKSVIDDSYTVLITLQQIMVYEGQGEVEATSLDLVRKNYIKKIQDAGIDFNRFKRNTYYEFATSYSQNRESACYYIKTTDKDEVRKIMQVKSAGMSITNIDITPKKLAEKDLVKLSAEAIGNAEIRAKAIAGKMNKKIGEIVNITDQNTSKQYVQDYGVSTTQVHSVSVSFELL